MLKAFMLKFQNCDQYFLTSLVALPWLRSSLYLRFDTEISSSFVFYHKPSSKTVFTRLSFKILRFRLTVLSKYRINLQKHETFKNFLELRGRVLATLKKYTYRGLTQGQKIHRHIYICHE
jgi:hypothetical protein